MLTGGKMNKLITVIRNFLVSEFYPLYTQNDRFGRKTSRNPDIYTNFFSKLYFDKTKIITGCSLIHHVKG